MIVCLEVKIVDALQLMGELEHIFEYTKLFKISFFSQYKEMVYKVLNSWLRVSGGAFHANFQIKLIDCILEDITPTKNEIKLTVSMMKASYNLQ